MDRNPEAGSTTKAETSTQTPSAIVKVAFHGDEVHAVRDGERLLVVVKPVCTNLGVDYASQWKRLQRTAWATVAMTTTVAQDGKIRKQFCVDLDTLPMWLATIDASRVSEDVRPKLERYQRQCAKVLHDHFFGARASAADHEAMRKQLAELEQRLAAAAGGASVAGKFLVEGRWTFLDDRGAALMFDLDLARMLGYPQQRVVRDHVKHLALDKILDHSDFRCIARPGPGAEYWLALSGARKVAASSGAPSATAEVERAFELAELRVAELRYPRGASVEALQEHDVAPPLRPRATKTIQSSPEMLSMLTTVMYAVCRVCNTRFQNVDGLVRRRTGARSYRHVLCAELRPLLSELDDLVRGRVPFPGGSRKRRHLKLVPDKP